MRSIFYALILLLYIEVMYTDVILGMANKNNNAFTIVELLIVIVVVGIIAAISMVAYTNIQQRANNSSIISSVNQTTKAIQGYAASKGEYPATANACVTTVSGCQASSTSDGTVPNNSTFEANISTIARLPATVPASGTRLFGITYVYDAAVTFEGQQRPAMIVYYLFGINQQCGVSGIVSDGSYPSLSASATGYSGGNDGGLGKTKCRISLPSVN
jgi:prepilin-type N-terminal cleavage/methylation domain-containing protein